MADRTRVVPVTLCFVRAAGKLLLVRVDRSKPHFGGYLNGLGGHVAPGEDLRESARRELREESGLDVPGLALRGVLHEVGLASSDRLVFIFVGDLPAAAPLRGSREGEVGWFETAALPWDELVPDLVEFLPRMLESDELLFMTVAYKGDEGAYSFTIS